MPDRMIADRIGFATITEGWSIPDKSRHIPASAKLPAYIPTNTRCILLPKPSLKGAFAFWTGAMARIGYALIAAPKASSASGSFCSTSKAAKRPHAINVQHRRCV